MTLTNKNGEKNILNSHFQYQKVFAFVDMSWPLSDPEASPWQDVPHLTSHHSRIEAPEAQSQDFCLHFGTLASSVVRPHKVSLGIGDVRRHLVGPSIAPLQSHAVVIGKPVEQKKEQLGTGSAVCLSPRLCVGSDLQSSLNKKSSTMNRPLRTVEVAELMVGTCTTSSTWAFRSSFSSTAARCCCHTEGGHTKRWMSAGGHSWSGARRGGVP